jgi:hypothetical protein
VPAEQERRQGETREPEWSRICGRGALDEGNRPILADNRHATASLSGGARTTTQRSATP